MCTYFLFDGRIFAKGVVVMPVSEKQKGYSKKYLEKLDEIKIRPTKGTKERWCEAAHLQQKSLNQFVIDAVETAIKQSNL